MIFKDKELLAETYNSVLKENARRAAAGLDMSGAMQDQERGQESFLQQLEAKGEQSSANETQQMINNIAQICHTLLTGGGAGAEYSGIKLSPQQRQVIEQIGKHVINI
jgi:hypothetical protein